jgi:hypothetical protein
MQPNLTFNITDMKNENFEEKLNAMTKPELPDMKHQQMLADAIINARDKSVVSLWWLSIPVFIILMLTMKSLYVPGSTLISNIKALAESENNIYRMFFLIAPLILIIINAFAIKKVFFLSGSPKSFNFIPDVWFNILIIILSLVILTVYII